MPTLARPTQPSVVDLSLPEAPTAEGWYAGFGSYLAHRPALALGRWRPAPSDLPEVFIARCMLWVTATPAAAELIRCSDCDSEPFARNGIQAC